MLKYVSTSSLVQLELNTVKTFPGKLVFEIRYNQSAYPFFFAALLLFSTQSLISLILTVDLS